MKKQFFLVRRPRLDISGVWVELYEETLAYDGPITADEVKRRCVENGHPPSITVDEIKDLVARVQELERRIGGKDALIILLNNNNREEK